MHRGWLARAAALALLAVLLTSVLPVPASAGRAVIGTGGALYASTTANYTQVEKVWSSPNGGKIYRVHFKMHGRPYYSGATYTYDMGRLYYQTRNDAGWYYYGGWSSTIDRDFWVDFSGYNPDVVAIKVAIRTDYSSAGGAAWADVPEVDAEVGMKPQLVYDNTDPYWQQRVKWDGAAGGKTVQSTGNTLKVEFYEHGTTRESSVWDSGGKRIYRARVKGNSEANYDYGYLKIYDGSSWRTIGGWSGSYDTWVDLTGYGYITKLQTRLSTDGSVLWNPNYVDVPEAEVDVPAESYQLWRKTLDANGNVVEDKAIYDGPNREFVTTDQGPGKYYQYRVRALVNGSWTPFSLETAYWTQSAPTLSPSKGGLTVFWPKVMNGLTYRVWYAQDGGSWAQAGTTTSLSYTIAGLNPASRYHVAVSPVLPEGGTDWWYGAPQNPKAPLAYTPGTPAFSGATPNSVQASWGTGGNPGGVKYEVWYKPASPFKGNGTFNAIHGEHAGNPVNSKNVYTYLGGGWWATTSYNSARIRAAQEGSNYFLRLVSDGSGRWAGATNWWSIKAGKWYRVTVSARTSSTSALNIYGHAIHNPDFAPTLNWNGLKSSDGWRTAYVIFQADKDRSGGMSLYGHVGSPASGVTVDYDNVIVEEFGSRPPDRPGTLAEVAGATTATSYWLTGLQPASLYDFSVQAVNADGVPSRDGYATAVAKTAPAAPGALNGESGGLDWSNSAGRGWVTLSWPAVQGATGYKVHVFDGNAYRAFDVGNALSWDSRAAKIYPAESTLDSYADNSRSDDLFSHNGSGLDLRDTPNKLYKKTVGTGYDGSHNYWFRLSAYNEAGDSGINWSVGYSPTLPNRTDTTAPAGTILVQNDQMVAGGPTVILNLSASDPAVSNYTSDTGDDASGVRWMRFSNDNTTWSDWVDYAETYAWKLDTAGFGKKTVYAQFKDLAGNESSVVGDDIFYYLVDAQAPSVSARINGGSSYTSSSTVQVEIQARDDLTPASALQMRLSNEYPARTGWEPYQPYRSWTLAGGDGTRTVYVEVKDTSGNIGMAYASITVKTAGDTVTDSPAVFASASGTAGYAYLNGQSIPVRFVSGSQVVLTLNAPGLSQVRFSLDGMRWLPPEPVLPEKTVSLPDWEGLKTVYAKLSNETVYIVRFVLDRTPPSLEATWLGGATLTGNGAATLVLNATDNFSRQSDLQYSIDGGTSWLPYAQLVPVGFTGSGYKTVTLMVRDQAGNISSKVLGIFNR